MNLTVCLKNRSESIFEMINFSTSITAFSMRFVNGLCDGLLTLNVCFPLVNSAAKFRRISNSIKPYRYV